jgi:hypothetical protein
VLGDRDCRLRDEAQGRMALDEALTLTRDEIAERAIRPSY